MFGWGKLNLSVSNDVINQVMKVVSLLSPWSMYNWLFCIICGG